MESELKNKNSLSSAGDSTKLIVYDIAFEHCFGQIFGSGSWKIHFQADSPVLRSISQFLSHSPLCKLLSSVETEFLQCWQVSYIENSSYRVRVNLLLGKGLYFHNTVEIKWNKFWNGKIAAMEGCHSANKLQIMKWTEILSVILLFIQVFTREMSLSEKIGSWILKYSSVSFL